MGSTKSRKFEKLCTVAEAAGLMKALGASLEGTQGPELAESGIDLKDCAKLKLSMKKKGDSISVKVKMKAASAATQADEGSDEQDDDDDDDDEDDQAGPGLQPYKKLKKRMSKDFKALRKCIEMGDPVPEELSGRFFADAGAMTQYPGKGEEGYEDFRSACRALQGALQGSADVQQALLAVESIKKGCHARHK